MKKLIYGVATNSGGKYKATIDGKIAKPYRTWQNMLKRVYCLKSHATWPTYIGCSVTDEWLEYQNFAEWFEAHEHSNRGYELDKDLLIPGNKIYAPDRCAFVPRQLNSLLNGQANRRGKFLQGVCFHKQHNKFVAQMAIDGKQKGLGLFDTELDAYHAYKKAKEQHVKDMTNHWRDGIADEVYHALMRWELEDAGC